MALHGADARVVNISQTPGVVILEYDPTEAVIDSIQLHKQALEGTLASNQAGRPSTRLRTPIVPRRMQRVGK